MSLQFTPADAIPDLVQEVRDTFRSGKTLPNEFRKHQLLQLYQLVKQNESLLAQAVKSDLNKHSSEWFVTEVAMLYNDITLMHDKLDEWTKPEKVDSSLINKFDNPQIRRDPLGVVLIIGAWNYPVQLTLVPLVGAIAGGNCCIIKPSELAPNTARIIAELVPKYLDQSCFKVVNGAVNETAALLDQKFDHILYTGGGQVGKIVAQKAAASLTPVTLELGGKSPCIVDKDVNVAVAARRIAWGRFMNCGQTCIAPDYVLAPKSLQSDLVKHMKLALDEFYGPDPQKSDHYGRIINDRHFQRLKGLLDAKGAGEVRIGGTTDAKDRYFSPTVLTNVSVDSPVMKEEIFGPILPIVDCESPQEAINFVNDRDKPLALYVFSNNSQVIEQVLNTTSSGGAVANDVLMHSAVDTLPFGGVGPSGYGAYHGKHSFDLFTHRKSVLKKDLSMEFVNAIRYPPYTENKLGWLKWLAVKTPGASSAIKNAALAVGTVAVIALAVAYRYH